MGSPLPIEIKCLNLLETEYAGDEIYIDFMGFAHRNEVVDFKYTDILSYTGSAIIPANLEDGWYYTETLHMEVTPGKIGSGWDQTRSPEIQDTSFSMFEPIIMKIENGKVFLYSKQAGGMIFGYPGTQNIDTAGKNTINTHTHFNVSPSDTGAVVETFDIVPVDTGVSR